jgi:hypothetical protein
MKPIALRVYCKEPFAYMLIARNWILLRLPLQNAG